MTSLLHHPPLPPLTLCGWCPEPVWDRVSIAALVPWAEGGTGHVQGRIEWTPTVSVDYGVSVPAPLQRHLPSGLGNHR